MDIKTIKNLNNMSVAAQNAKLGDILVYLLEENESMKIELKKIKEEKINKVENIEIRTLDNQPKSKASTIKELVNDYNSLISNLEKSGYIKK